MMAALGVGASGGTSSATAPGHAVDPVRCPRSRRSRETPEQRATGLMYRFSLPADRGMLFVFQRPEPLGFWMRNTYIPLSIAFIDAEGRILDVLDMAPQTQSRIVQWAGLYALEMRKGWFAEEREEGGGGKGGRGGGGGEGGGGGRRGEKRKGGRGGKGERGEGRGREGGGGERGGGGGGGREGGGERGRGVKVGDRVEGLAECRRTGELALGGRRGDIFVTRRDLCGYAIVDYLTE